MAVKEPEKPCLLCKTKGEPRYLVTLPEVTSSKSLEVQVCPNCDGGVVTLASR